MELLNTRQTFLASAQAEETEAEVLAAGLDVSEILKCRQIVGMMEVQGVPSSTLLVKGILEGEGKTIPLVDLRMKLGATHIGRTDDASVLIVLADGREVGLMVGRSGEA